MHWSKLDQNKSPTASYCIHGNEPSGSVRGKEFLDSINDYQSKKGSTSQRVGSTSIHKAGTNSATSDQTESRVISTGKHKHATRACTCTEHGRSFV